MKANAKQISIFLQCQEASSLHFYRMIGFHKINSHSEDGFDLLPKHMQMNLKSLRPNDPGHNSGFIFYDKDSDLKPSFLMHLRPGGLRHHEEEIDLNLEAQKSVVCTIWQFFQGKIAWNKTLSCLTSLQQKPSSTSERRLQLWDWCLCWHCNYSSEFS